LDIKNWQLAKKQIRIARFFLVQHKKTGEMTKMTIKYTKRPQNIPNGRKKDLMAIKYINNVHYKTLENLPKLGFLVWKYAIWQPWFWQRWDRDFAEKCSNKNVRSRWQKVWSSQDQNFEKMSLEISTFLFSWFKGTTLHTHVHIVYVGTPWRDLISRFISPVSSVAEGEDANREHRQAQCIIFATSFPCL
jgi:hypothetical protein